jgi:hypothetical protein
MNYVAICKCQVCVAAVSDELPEKDVARALSDWVKDGLTIERKDDAFVREQFGFCRCEKVEPVKQLSLL